MKIKTVFVILFVISVIQLSAQAPMTSGYAKALEGISFGIKGGLNFSTQDFSYETTEDAYDLGTASLTALHFGLFADISLSEKLDLRPELLYSKEGAKINLIITDFKQTFTFLKVPILLAYKPIERLSIHAGPQFGFLLKEEINVPIEDAEIIKSAYKDFELSAALGLEYGLSSKFVLGARYNIGLTNMSENNDISLKGSNLQLYLGFRLF